MNTLQTQKSLSITLARATLDTNCVMVMGIHVQLQDHHRHNPEPPSSAQHLYDDLVVFCVDRFCAAAFPVSQVLIDMFHF